jgi:4-hydroxybenzoate polyprenyltransferase
MTKLLSTISAFLRLVRVPNLAIIILTQFLLRYGIQRTFLFNGDKTMMSGLPDFLFLVGITVLVAMGGYVINDYFDVQIDAVNRPEKNEVGKRFSASVILNIYLIVTGVAVLSGFYLAFRLKSLTFGLIFPFIAGLLWFYSERYKKMVIRGNIIVAVLSAFVILIVWYFEFLHLRLDPVKFSQIILNMKDANFFFVFYALFAFLCSLFREVIKDMEDLDGDRAYGCTTIPIMIGVKRTKWIVAALVVMTVVLLGFGQATFSSRGYSLVFWYFLAVVQIPLAYLLFRIFAAKEKDDYRFLSLLCKIIMVAGLLSIQLLSISP